MIGAAPTPVADCARRIAIGLVILVIGALIAHIVVMAALASTSSKGELLSLDAFIGTLLFGTLPFAALWGGAFILCTWIGGGSPSVVRGPKDALLRKKFALGALGVAGLASTVTGFVVSLPRGYSLIDSFWAVALVAWLAVVARPARVIDLACGFHHRGIVKDPRGPRLCWSCRYDLSYATSDRCPECGEPIEVTQIHCRWHCMAQRIARMAVTLAVGGSLFALLLYKVFIDRSLYTGSMRHVATAMIGIAIGLGMVARSRLPIAVWFVIGMGFVLMYSLVHWDERAVASIRLAVEPGMTRAEADAIVDASSLRSPPPAWRIAGERAVLEIEVNHPSDDWGTWAGVRIECEDGVVIDVLSRF